MTVKRYENMVRRLKQIRKEAEKLEESILKYENENCMIQIDCKDDLDDFLLGRPQDGTQFMYKDEKFEVEGIQEFIEDYGQDQWSQSFDSDLDDLISGGRIGILNYIS